MAKVRFSRRAEADFDDITAYTARTWDSAQADRYRRVEVESEVGRGSTFSVHLPIRSPDEITGIHIPGLAV